jgi:hypothetical protein
MKPRNSLVGFVPFLMLAAVSDAQAAWPPSNCTHVAVLESGHTDQISWRFDGGVTARGARLEDAGRNQLDALGEALDILPDVLCQAVRKVAFVYRPPDDDDGSIVGGWTTRNDRQNMVYLNTHSLSPWNEGNLGHSDAARQQAIHRAVHESTHAAVRLLQSQQKAEPLRAFQERADASLWPPNAQQLAKDIIAANRLQGGVLREWQRIHDAFVAAGMAEPYYGGDWTEKEGFSVEALAKAGFMSAYGGEQAIEDLAEMTSWAILRSANTEPKDAACQVMKSRSDSGVKSDDAAVFTKLGFVRTLNFIPEQAYKSCIGSLNFDSPGPGFHSYKSGNLSRSYIGGVRAGAGREDDGEHFLFDMEADGMVGTSSGDVAVRMGLILDITRPVDSWTDHGRAQERRAMTLDDLSYPRGVYFIGFRHGKRNRLQIARQDDGDLIMDVGQGVALIGRASTEVIEGSVFVQRIFNYSGGLLSAIAGDEPVSESSRVTFRYEPRGN